MKINGAKYLNANDYKNISIIGIKDDYKCNVTGPNRHNLEYKNKTITKDLKSLNNSESTLYILDYFLRYNRLSKYEEVLNTRYQLPGIKLVSTNGKSIFISVPNNIESANIIRMHIIEALKKQLYEIINNVIDDETIKYISVFSQTANTYNYEIYRCNIEEFNKLIIAIPTKDEEMMQYIVDVVLEKMKQMPNDINLKLPSHKIYFGNNDYIYSDDISFGNGTTSLIITQPSDNTIYYISEEVNTYENEVNNNKKRQLKMEGF